MKKRYIIIVASSVAVALLVSLRPQREEIATTTIATPEPAQASSAPEQALRALDTSPPLQTVAAPPRSKPPVFDEAWLEKTAVCRNENNAIHVRAHAEDGIGSNGFLTVSTIHPETGKTLRGTHIPFQMETAGEHEIIVNLESIGGAQSVTLPLQVKACEAERSLGLQVKRTFNEPDVVRFSAQLRESQQTRPLKPPVTYHWDFGDDTSEDTNSPEVTHSYEGRSQESAESVFVVKVTAKGSAGEVVTAAHPVSFRNTAFVMLHYDNRLSISVGVKPAKADQPEQIRLYHGYHNNVRIERLRLREAVFDDPKEPEKEVFAREYEPMQVLGFTELPPRTSMVLPDLSWLQPAQAGAVRYVEVTGRTADGKLASATFTLLPPRTSMKVSP